MSVISPLQVEEGKSSNTAFEIVIQLSAGLMGIPIERDIVYTVELQDGTANGEQSAHHVFCT